MPATLEAVTRSAAERLARYAGQLESLIRRRDAAIREMRDEGASLRDIAKAARLTAPGVAKVLKRKAPEG